MTIWLGLTGGIGSGKSQVAAEFSSFGVPIIDSDGISRQLTARNGIALPLIRQQFGDNIFHNNGELNRNKLRELIFQNETYKNQLEILMFPLILDGIYQQKQLFSQAIYGIIEIPLLIEKKEFLKIIQEIIVVEAQDELRIKRIKSRNGLSDTEINRIMQNQTNNFTRRQYADEIILNEGSLTQLRRKTARLHHYYRAKFTRTNNTY